MTTATTTRPTLDDLIQAIRRMPGGMATTWDLAGALALPETAIAPLTAQARYLGLITTERDPRTPSPMHRLTAADRDRAPHVLDRSPSAAVARATYNRAATAEARTVAAILSPAYLAYVLGQGPRPHVP